jgi:hypothetical protein
MQTTRQIDSTTTYPSSIRAEDGKQPGRWNVLCEGVLIPLGSLFAVFLCMLAVMLIAD